MKWNFRSWLLFIIIFLLASAAVWFGYYKWYLGYWIYRTRPESHMVQGQVTAVTNLGIDLNGVHILDKYPQNSDFRHPEWIGVKWDSNTKFVKTIWYMPTKAELAKTNGVWYPDKLRKETAAGSIDDFKNTQGLPIAVKTANNSIGDRIVTAAEIDYVIQVYPPVK